jgi:hypothetical protein
MGFGSVTGLWPGLKVHLCRDPLSPIPERRAGRTYVDPSTVVPDCYDTVVNPGARSWFKESAVNLIDMTRIYLALLDRYDVP